MDPNSGQGFFYQATQVSSGLKISPHAIVRVDPNQARVYFLPGCIRGNGNVAEAIGNLRQTGYEIREEGAEKASDAGRYKTDSHGKIERIPPWAYK